MVFRGKCPLFAPHLQVNFRESFLERRAVLFPPPSESVASVGKDGIKKVQRSPSGLKGGGRNLGFLGGSIPGFQGKFHHPVPLEREKRLKPFPVQHGGQPEPVILPHEVIGNPVHRTPEGLRLGGFRGGACKRRRHKHMAAVMIQHSLI